jgi:pimeloyl-ACP methyl ester carboxylesterase
MEQHIPESVLRQARLLGDKLNALAQVMPDRAGQEAFRIFCTPRPLEIRARDAAFLDTAHQETLVLHDLPIHVYHWPGEGADAPVVLFLHGWESHSGRWHSFVRPLQQAGFAISALDAPAHGRSGGDMLNVLLYSQIVKAYVELRGRPHAAVGHSLGGAALVMSMAALQTPPVEKAVLMGTFAESERILRDFGAIMGLQPIVMEAALREVQRLNGMPIEAYSVVEKAALLRSVSALVIHDHDDGVAPIADGRAIAGAWGARLLETRGLGHSLQGPKVVEAVVGFLRET